MPVVCVIGAGVSGIAAARALRKRSIPYEVFEKGSQAGGLWRYGNDNGLSGIYDSLHLNTSKAPTAFSDFPMPRDYPDYPDHRQFVKYLDRVIDHFGLLPSFRFRTEVTQVVPQGSVWTVRLADGSTRSFDAVVVASGHHWKPRHPTYRGRISGQTLHSHEYRTPEAFKGRRVLVVGFGNSAVDIACEISRVAHRTILSTRRGAHVLPKYLLGRPIDRWAGGPLSYLPPRIQGWIISAAVRLVRGPIYSYGLPKPAHRVEQAHPTLSSELPALVRNGTIQMRPDVRCLANDRVFFADGTEERVDVLITATGYDVAHPFLGDPPVHPDALYQHVVDPERPGLYFVGLVQPFQGPVLRTAEFQSQWVSGLISGDYGLPEPEEIRVTLTRDRALRTSAFVESPRHGFEVDYYRYLRELRREMDRRRKNPAMTKRWPSNDLTIAPVPKKED